MIQNMLSAWRHYKPYTHPRYADLAQEVLLVRKGDSRRGTSSHTIVRAMIGDCDRLPNPKKLKLELMHPDHGVWELSRRPADRTLVRLPFDPTGSLDYEYKKTRGELLLWRGGGYPPPLNWGHLWVAQPHLKTDLRLMY